MKLTLALAVLGGMTVWAADITPPNLQPGEWEYTVSMKMGGAQQQALAKSMPQIPPETLAKLPPDQRAKLEAAMKQAGAIANGTPTTSKNCIKKEDLANFNPLNNDKSCKTTVTSSTRTKFEGKVECNDARGQSSVTFSASAPNPQTFTFNAVGKGTQGGAPMDMTINGTGRWLSATCTEK